MRGDLGLAPLEGTEFVVQISRDIALVARLAEEAVTAENRRYPACRLHFDLAR